MFTFPSRKEGCIMSVDLFVSIISLVLASLSFGITITVLIVDSKNGR